ncbi:MAG TPA: FeoB-associated Cys-rich membrane protein [Spirochaetota bacterium]|nr:FeoB-associated Cys-rich membrane protein [Spirochaetota bacterium]
MQTVIALVIVFAAAAFAVYRVVRFFRKPGDHACSPDKCASCPLASGECPGSPDETVKPGRDDSR